MTAASCCQGDACAPGRLAAPLWLDSGPDFSELMQPAFHSISSQVATVLLLDDECVCRTSIRPLQPFVTTCNVYEGGVSAQILSCLRGLTSIWISRGAAPRTHRVSSQWLPCMGRLPSVTTAVPSGKARRRPSRCALASACKQAISEQRQERRPCITAPLLGPCRSW